MEASGAMKFGRFVAGAGTAAFLLASGVVLVETGLHSSRHEAEKVEGKQSPATCELP